MEAITCLTTRRSIRKYKDKEIPEEDIQQIIECGRRAPSGRNVQPWKFVVIKDKERLAKLAKVCVHGSFIRKAALCIVVVCAPDTKHAVVDGSTASENILLAAHALGYGGCWVAGHNMEYADQVLEEINGQGHKLISILSLGIPASQPGPRKLKDIDDIIYRECING